MKNITRNELLTVGLFSIFVLIAAVLVSFGGNYNLGPISMVSRYVAQTLSTQVQTVSAPATIKTATTAVRTDTTVTATQLKTSAPGKTECNDGVDNDKDGDADAFDYSCAKGTTEDAFEKSLTPQVIEITWPRIPPFSTRSQCNNYCAAVRNACTRPYEIERDETQRQCFATTACIPGEMAYCRDYEPPRKPGCDRATCSTCFADAARKAQRHFDACIDAYDECKRSCDRVFPRTSTSPAVGAQ